MKTTYILFLLFTGTFTCISQPDLDGRYELGGSVGYSYTSMNLLGSHESQSIFLQPRIGFFLTSAFEVNLGPTIQLSYTKTGNTIVFINGVPYSIGESKSESYGLGLTPGVTYHFLVDDVFIPYVGLSATLFWQRNLSSFLNRWSKPSISAPIIDAGVRIFVSKDWALEIGLVYSKILQQSGDSQINGYNVSLGTGFAILL